MESWIMATDDTNIRTSLQQQLEAEQLARTEAEERVAELQRFIRDAGHDLKTPLTTLKTSLYLLQRSAEMATPKRLDMMTGQVERLSHLVETILLLSRLNGGETLEFDETNLHMVINEAIMGVQSYADQRRISFELDIPTPIPSVQLNFERFKSVIINMLDNAIRYTDEGGIISIYVYEQHNFLVLDIVDAGKGMSEEEVMHVFDYFYRGEDAGNADDKGAGLGLPIAKRIVELHGGKCRVMSELGVGSTFRVMLPLLD